MEAFAAETVSLIKDQERRCSIADAGREHVRRNYSWPRVAEVFFETYRSTFAAPSSTEFGDRIGQPHA